MNRPRNEYAYQEGKRAYNRHHETGDFELDRWDNNHKAGSWAWFSWWDGWHDRAKEIKESEHVEKGL